MNVLSIPGLDITWDATLRNVVFGSMILGLTSGVLGSFAVLRRQSLIGDALAHAALPGICLMFMLTSTRSSELLLLGGALSGLVGTAFALIIGKSRVVKPETALGIVLSVFFGFGILLLTRIQHTNNAGQSGLDRFIFGQAATILPRDVWVMAAIAIVAMAVVFALFKELKVLCFDQEFGASIGARPGLVSAILSGLLVLAVMIGLQTVGVILMVSLLIAPAVAARQWVSSMEQMVILSGIFGMLAGVAGAVTSSTFERLPTGPMIVIAASVIVTVSLLAAPGRGVIATYRETRRRARRLRAELILADHHGGGIAR